MFIVVISTVFIVFAVCEQSVYSGSSFLCEVFVQKSTFQMRPDDLGYDTNESTVD
jgi:hypothetical protein